MSKGTDIFAVVDLKSPLYHEIVHVFGTRRLPLVDARLIANTGPGLPASELFFKVDPERLTPQQITRWSNWMAARFHLPVVSVLRDMRNPDHGIPLLQVHVLKLEPEGTEPLYPRRLATLPNGPISMRMFY